ncbi:hypothetical protein ABK040_004016 [Willaertia magna]
MPKKNVSIIKFGGSCLTNKETKHSYHEENINWCCDQIQYLYQQQIPTIIIHGAGSFGHFEWNEVKTLLKSEKENNHINHNILMKIVETKHAVETLNHYLIKKCLKKNIPVIGISLFAYPSIHSQEFKELILKLLSQGCVPILHGDINFQNNVHYSASQLIPFKVISGDDIIDALSFHFATSNDIIEMDYSSVQFIFVTDVYGAYLTCPSNKNDLILKDLIKEIKVGNNEKEYSIELYDRNQNTSIHTEHNSIQTTITHQHDVTGGFERKLSTALRIAAKRGHTVFIIKSSTDYLKQLSNLNETAAIPFTFIGTKIYKDICN